MKNKYKEEMKAAGKQLPLAHRVPFNTTIQRAIPSSTHMAMVELMNRGHLKGVISQNIDGLHRKSGIDPSKMSEVHGNTNLELCLKCGREHMSDYQVRTGGKDHKTGRICATPGCKGELKDSIINFGDSLVPDIYHKGVEIGANSDLALCMGSSMRVPPACNMPIQALANPNGKLVMINLQKTPVDEYCTLVINEKTDKVMEMVMSKLNIPIPQFKRNYRLKVFLTNDKKSVKFSGVDSNGAVYTIFRNIKIYGLGSRYTSLPSGPGQAQPY